MLPELISLLKAHGFNAAAEAAPTWRITPVQISYRIFLWKAFRSARRAVTTLEYGIIASILGLVLVTIFKTFGTSLSTLFTVVGKSI